jgi:hypothetical protein
MKKLLVLFVLLSSFHFYAQEKIYYTKDFKELNNIDGATYYSTYEESENGTQRKTYYLDGSIRNTDQFSNLKRKIRNGRAETWYKNGSKKTVAIYIKDKLEGAQTGYYENGQVKRIENFKNNKFIDGKCFDENGTEIAFFAYHINPVFPGGMTAFYKYVGENFNAPNSAKGRIEVNFVVEIDGALRDFKITEGLNYAMNVEALRVLFNSPPWIPGKIDGEDASVAFSIPITIR